MQELVELRKRIEEQDYQAALEIIDELEEMSKEDKINKICSYMVILLLHLIKQKVENRTTKSWQRSIDNSIYRINRTNKRRKSGRYYANQAQLEEIITETLEQAFKEASYEAFEGALTPEELIEKVDLHELKKQAIASLNT